MFNLILEDTNILEDKTKYLSERKSLLKQLEEQQSLISKARKLFVDDKLKFDDFRVLKKEYQDISGVLQKEFNVVRDKLKRLDWQIARARNSFEEIFQMLPFMDIADIKQIESLIPRTQVSIEAGEIVIELNVALTKILHYKRQIS